MSQVPGMLTLDELRIEAQAGRIDTVLVALTDLYGRFMGKRFEAQYFLNAIAENGTHACDYLLTVDMEMEPVQGYRFANWEKGYGDFHLAPDLSTLRRASWLDRSAIVLCDVELAATNQLAGVAPRTILKQQVAAAAELGYQVMAGSEIEYYLYRETYRDAFEKGYHRLSPLSWYLEDYHLFHGTREEPFNAAVRRHLSHSGIPVESSKGEWGLGQHEMNVRYAAALEMADRHALYKQCMKDIADHLGMSVTFMAKAHEDQAGSSCHVHLSLWKDGEPVFPGNSPARRATGSEIFRWFLAGWMEHAAEMCLFYAPTVNSYKRFRASSWAPTRIAWSYDNRTAGFRIVGQDAGLRIECRIPGADCNPYLAFAASIASGLDGIRRQLEPPAAVDGDIYFAEVDLVPSTMAQAIEKLEKSNFARKSFGSEVIDHYLHFFRTELTAYDRAVTDWERKRYFERI